MYEFSNWRVAFEVKVKLREYTKEHVISDSCLRDKKGVGDYVNRQLVLDFACKYRFSYCCTALSNPVKTQPPNSAKISLACQASSMIAIIAWLGLNVKLSSTTSHATTSTSSLQMATTFFTLSPFGRRAPL